MGSHAITYAAVALAIAAVCLIAGFSWGRSNVKTQIEQAVEKEHVALDAREFAMRTQLEDALAEIAKLRPLAEELGRVQKRLEREQAKYAQMKAEFNAAAGLPGQPSVDENSDTEQLLAQRDESADEAIQKLLQSLEVFNDPNAPVDPQSTTSEAPPPPIPSAPQPTRAPQPAKNAAPPRAPEPAARPAEPVRPVTPARPAAPLPPRAPVAAAVPARPAAAIPPRPTVPPAPQPAAAADPRRPVTSIPAQPTPAAAAPAAPARPTAAQSASPGKAGKQDDEWQEFARQLEALTGKKK